MKRHSNLVDILIFLIISVFFIIPPLFLRASNVDSDLFTEWNFPVQQFFMAITGFVIYLLYGDNKKFWLKIFPALYSFCLLLCISFFIKFLSLVFTVDTGELSVMQPDSFIKWTFCILNFAFAAFYEEIIYRLYFTDSLYLLLNKKIKGKLLIVICEIAGCCVFGFAHFYTGFFSVINALLAHIVLRFCYKKTGTIWPCFAAHFAYNVISLILL